MISSEIDKKPFQVNKKHVAVTFWNRHNADFDTGLDFQDRSFPYCRNSVLSLLLFGLVLFNLAFLFQGLLVIPQRSVLAKICQPLSVPVQPITESQIIDIIFFGKYAYRNMKIVRGIDRTISSILKNTVNPIHLHVLLDMASKKRVSRTLKKVSLQYRRKVNVTYYDVTKIASMFQATIKTIKRFFFSKDVGRYNDDIFFMSEIFHLAFPKSLSKAIFLDIDLKFIADIKELYKEFEKFSSSNIIGIGPDLQPQYREDFAKFRSNNPGTLVGAPRPGKQGFNTGITLFHFKRMRKAALYQFLLNDTVLESLCDKYDFKGYLGHQDFFTLTGMEYPELYYNLDCAWNRQLDTGWRKSVGGQVFDSYHSCNSDIKVYHGNGNANIPDDL